MFPTLARPTQEQTWRSVTEMNVADLSDLLHTHSAPKILW